MAISHGLSGFQVAAAQVPKEVIFQSKSSKSLYHNSVCSLHNEG